MKPIDSLNFDPSRDHYSGISAAESVLILYGDYTSPISRRAHQIDLRLSERLDTSSAFVYRQNPSPERGEASLKAARFAVSAGRQGKFWEAHDQLFVTDPDMPDSALDSLASELGLNKARLASDMASQGVARKIEEDRRSAGASEVADDPALFINGKRYAGAWDELSIIEEIERPFGVRLRDARERFFAWAASAGFVLILATIAALLFVNLGFHETYETWRETEFGFSFGEASFALTIEAWINDGLMAIFFLIVGIEIKREILYGELSSMSKAILPLIGAIGGIVAPILLYLAFNAGLDTQGGWGIPMATDIAFTLGLIALLGSRVPLPLKIFVSALAIADDLGAILVIAVFYGHGFHLEPLLWAIGVLSAMLIMNRSRIYARTPYIILALFLWYFTHESGLHATLAGVLTTALIPSRNPANVKGVAAQTAAILGAQKGEEVSSDALHMLQNAVERLREPGYHLQHRLEAWSNYLILPLFAFFNTGIILTGGGSSATSPASLGVILGLVVGKPLGICLSCWLAVRFGFATLSNEVTWPQMLGAGCLAGIGFTMSIFIATSAFEGELLNSVKLSVLIASVVAAVLGSAILVGSQPSRNTDTST